jgi:hypothetical protein
MDHEVGTQASHRLTDELGIRDVEVGKVGQVRLGAELVEVLGDPASEEPVRARDKYTLAFHEVGREHDLVLGARQQIGIPSCHPLGEYLGEVV